MNKINIRGFILQLHFETQISPLGRPIRLSGIEKNLQIPSKWIDKTEKWHWIYTFIYLDTKEIIKFEFDFYDTYTSKRNT